MSALTTNKCTNGFVCVFPIYKFGLGTHALNYFVVELVYLVVFFLSLVIYIEFGLLTITKFSCIVFREFCFCQFLFHVCFI